jgi:hypothetical protein
MFKVNDSLIAEKFSCLTWEECEPFLVFAYYTMAFALQVKEKARKNLSQGSRKVPGGHDSMCRLGRLLGVARTCCQKDQPVLGDLGQRSVSVDICRAA